MKERFSFLSDERALAEIRKHKWIESQKEGREIGFASSALDWIKRFGEQWKKVHFKKEKDYSHLFERRKFRRFKIVSDVKLTKDNLYFSAKAKEVSFTGLLCNSDEYISPSNEVIINFYLKCENRNELTDLKCKGRVNRVYPISSGGYDLFLRFDEAGQRYIEDCLVA